MMMLMILMVVLIPRKQPAVSLDRRPGGGGGAFSHSGEHRISATRRQACGVIAIQTEIVICTSRNPQFKVTLSTFFSLQIIRYVVMTFLDYL